MQRERQDDLYREKSSSNERSRHQQWQVKYKDKGPSADVNMVFMLPMEFLALSDDEEEVVLSDQVAQLALDPMMAVFEKPTDDERQHLKALFVKGRVDGQPISKILIDGGVAINIMPYVMYRKLGKGDQDLTKTDVMLKDFEGNVSPAKGAVCVELTIGSKTLPTTFFVINGKGACNLLLGREIEVVPGDSSYIIASVESDTYEQTKCILGEVWEKEFLRVADYEIPPIQAVGSDEDF
jgi:hypothetical protein